jgi:A/G-specific adenine glycosylase
MAAITKKNIGEFQHKLLSWFASSGRQFPWREEGLSEYQLVVVEILLQRTKAGTVAKFYDKFMVDYPNWGVLAEAELSSIETYLMPIGLYRQRAQRLQNLAKEMVRRNHRLPRDRAELENIPFFGQYMTNAIMLIIFNQPTPLVDVNMARVLERFFRRRKMADIRYDPYLQGLAQKVVNLPRSKELNWAVLDFAALVCKARNPRCSDCFLASKCTYYATT